jgi:small-conductance mechanosensitive channel
MNDLPRPRRVLRSVWSLPVALALALSWMSPARAARDDELVAQLREQILSLEKTPAESSGAFEKQRLDRRLASLRQELAVLEKRRALEAQERDLRETMAAQPQAQLRERLQAVAPDASATEARLRELAARRTAAMAERETLARRLAEVRRSTTPTALAEAADTEEKIITKDEELRSVALRTEAAENQGDLVRLAQHLRERLKLIEAAAARPTIRTLFAQQSEDEDDAKIAAQLGARIANLDATLRNGEAGLDLQRQKLAGFDEEIRLFDTKSGPAQRRTPRMEQLIATDRLQQRTLGERMPHLADQVEALRQSRAILLAQRELLSLAARVRADNFSAMQAAYVARLRIPGVIILVLIAHYIVLSRWVLPRRCKKEELFLARRVARYGTVFLAVVVIAFDSINDLRLLATTLGVASAGVVIALQDVATALFGWFTILLGRKFTVGDRLEIDGVRGDVLDIQLLRTTLVELNNWLGVDQPTGRVFIVPNNFVFKSKVFNYSHGHPYIWGVVDVTVTFATPVASALALFQKVLEEETREAFEEARVAAREMERRYGVEDADYQPKVYTRIADSGVTFSLLYVCHYRQAPVMKNRINRRLISELETHEHIRLAYPTRQVVNTIESLAPSAVLGQDSTRTPFLKTAK